MMIYHTIVFLTDIYSILSRHRHAIRNRILRVIDVDACLKPIANLGRGTKQKWTTIKPNYNIIYYYLIMYRRSLLYNIP